MQQIVPSPAVNGDSLIVTGGNLLAGPIMAVRVPPSPPGLGGGKRGGKCQTIWFNGKTGSNIVSPVCWDGLLFSVSHIGILTCRDAESGQIHWTKRLGSRCLASLVAGDGKVYALDQEGTLHVLAADATGSMLATHSLRENCSATPALAESLIFVRASGHLYGIGTGE
jgi:outer membrane protein assembly factor BamB